VFGHPALSALDDVEDLTDWPHHSPTPQIDTAPVSAKHRKTSPMSRRILSGYARFRRRLIEKIVIQNPKLQPS